MKKIGLAFAATIIPMLAFAQEIKGLRYSPPVATVDSEVVFQIDMSYKPNTSLVWCSLEVDFGNGETKKIRLGDDFKVKDTLAVPYTYAKAGEYVATVDGSFFIEGFSKVPAPPCEGKKQQVTIKVIKSTQAEQPATSVEQSGNSERSTASKAPSKPAPKVAKEHTAPIKKEEATPKPIEAPPAKPAPKPKAESIL